jgi:hypothetical protein
MKNTTLLYTLITLIFLFTIVASVNAQLPNFTKIDTGAITISPGGHLYSACFDMDNDGDQELLIDNSGVYIQRYFSIFKNEGSGYFEKIPGFIGNTSYMHVKSIGDIDNDGDMDLFAGNISANSLRIYGNDGYGNFQLENTISLIYSPLYPSLIDLNNDGFLDVVSINRNGSVNYNDGNGNFLGSTLLGLLHEPQNIVLHGMSWGDCDNDGDMDIYGGYSYDGDEGGHVSKNACFLNNGDGTFSKFDETSIIVDDSISENPCVNWVDYDNDGDMDLYVVNFTADSVDCPLNALYENMGNMQFTKHVFEDPMCENSFKISSVWGDLDNDADLDLYVTVENNPSPWTGDTSATPYNLLYVNDGNGGFTNILDHPLALEDSHTALMFDHDNDGDLDVLLTRYSWSNDGYTNIFENEGNDNSWIILTCEGTTSNRSAIGARIYAKSFINGHHVTQTREITPINGHLSYANLRVHFGLDDATKIDTLIIRWPSGHIDTYLNKAVNQFYRAIEDDTLIIDYTSNVEHIVSGKDVVISYPNPFTTSTTLSYELKQPEKVILTIYNQMGKQVYQTEENQSQGKQQLIWNAERYPDGIYYYRLQVGDAVANGKIVKAR